MKISISSNMCARNTWQQCKVNLSNPVSFDVCEKLPNKNFFFVKIEICVYGTLVNSANLICQIAVTFDRYKKLQKKDFNLIFTWQQRNCRPVKHLSLF